ncbi:Acyl-CoA N-acyltransferase [Coniochaeta hoffmannii]|uniref:Acyl-CoA N-acyltransferase n=1 Tax=Coniochaeta hoffmannii TaxID=91930 RepID=A0AA38RXI6_9PEZI|nr:Acyl-CoA N-acyltransferase [Coniochaeta hoffmannii]
MPPVSRAGPRRSKFEFLSSKWRRLFFATAAVQAIICMAFEAYVFAKFQLSIVPHFKFSDPQLNSQYKTIPTFLTLFVFAFIYELILVWDALRSKNTIQIIGLCICNPALLAYTALQIDQIGNAIDFLEAHNAIQPNALGEHDVWSTCRPFLIAIPCIIAVATLALAYISWQLYKEFAWDILKQIGADYRMKKRFLHYQIYIALLKFDFFFFLGFTVQFLVIVTGKTDVEFALTIAAIPVTIAILLCAAFFTRREIKVGMVAVMTLYFAGLAYFFFKLVRIYQPSHQANYLAVRRSLTAFAVMTIILIILTIVNAFICMSNFGKGLKNHLVRPSAEDEEKVENAYQMQDQKPQLPSRMTID